MCSRVPVPVMSLAAAFWTRCRGSSDGLRKCCQNGVAVVHSGCHKSRHQTRRDIGTEDSTDGFKAAKMEETGTDDGADIMMFH